MNSHNNPLWRLIGCQSADLIPVANAQISKAPPRSACQKADSMWDAKIVPSRYEQLPPLVSPGTSDILKLLTEGRRKLIHAFDAETRLRQSFPHAMAMKRSFPGTTWRES